MIKCSKVFGIGEPYWITVDQYFRYHFHRDHLLLDDFEVKREREWTAYVTPQGGLATTEDSLIGAWRKVRVREILEGES